MPVLQWVKPGAKIGQVILSVDLTVAGNAEDVLANLKELGYSPVIRYVNYTAGIHVIAVLKDEKPETLMDENYLMNEGIEICDYFNDNAVGLWRCL